MPACIVCYRTCALYGRNRTVVFSLVSFYLIAVVITILITITTLNKYTGTLHPAHFLCPY